MFYFQRIVICKEIIENRIVKLNLKIVQNGAIFTEAAPMFYLLVNNINIGKCHFVYCLVMQAAAKMLPLKRQLAVSHGTLVYSKPLLI